MVWPREECDRAEESVHHKEVMVPTLSVQIMRLWPTGSIGFLSPECKVKNDLPDVEDRPYLGYIMQYAVDAVSSPRIFSHALRVNAL